MTLKYQELEKTMTTKPLTQHFKSFFSSEIPTQTSLCYLLGLHLLSSYQQQTQF